MWGPSSLARTRYREGRRVLKAVKGRWGVVERGARPRAPPRRQRLWAPGASPQGAGRRWGLGPSPRPAASRTSPTSALLPGQWPRRPGRSLPGTGPCHLAACPVPGVTPGARRAFRWGRVCLLTRLLERDPRGSACSLGPWQGCHAVRTPPSPVQRAGAGGLRPAASSPSRCVSERPAAPVRPRDETRLSPRELVTAS